MQSLFMHVFEIPECYVYFFYKKKKKKKGAGEEELFS